jgi:hypothetical protein
MVGGDRVNGPTPARPSSLDPPRPESRLSPSASGGIDPIGDRAAPYGEIEGKFPVWLEAIEVTTGDQQARFAVVGFSLGGALACSRTFDDWRYRV